MRLIDLSQDIYEGMMVYPGHLKTVLFDHATHEETVERFEGGFSFQPKGVMLNDNGPTHVDSFSHLRKYRQRVRRAKRSRFGVGRRHERRDPHGPAAALESVSAGSGRRGAATSG